MECYIDNKPINILSMSNRTFNTLQRIGIHTVKELYELDPTTIVTLPNIGKVTINEIEKVKQKLNEGRIIPGDSYEANLLEKSKKTEKLQNEIFYNSQGILCFDISIERLKPFVRGYNCLKKAGFNYISQIIGMDTEELCKIKNMGKKTAQDIISEVNNIEFKIVDEDEFEKGDIYSKIHEKMSNQDKTILNLCMKKANAIFDVRFNEQNSLAKEFQLIISKTLELDNKGNMNDMLNKMVFDDNFKLFNNILIRSIMEKVKSFEYGCSRKILNSIYGEVFDEKNINKIISKLLEENELISTENGIEFFYPSIKEYIENMPEGRDRYVLESRSKGDTFEEIGKILEISRERVRQIQNKVFQGIDHIYEDRYKQVFLDYKFDKELFCYGFNQNELCYIYLETKYKREKSKYKQIEKLENDESYPFEFRRAGEKIVHRNELNIDGNYILKERTEIANFVAKTYCRDKTKFTDFVELYNIFLEINGLKLEDKLQIVAGTYENKFAKWKNILWNNHSSFRYYEFEKYDFNELLKAIDFYQYKDVEISTLKFFKEHLDVMKDYDIRDEYELHNLLKKVVDIGNIDVSFSRMPHIVFGKADTSKQVYDLLLQCASDRKISIDDFAEKYEEEYGVKVPSVKANYLEPIDKYLHDGLYEIRVKPLEDEAYKKLKLILNEDYYTINKLKAIFKNVHSNNNDINAYTIKQLGFNIYKDYVISTRYKSAVEYFRRLLSVDIFKLDNLETSIIYNGTFNAELYRKRENYDIIEYAPGSYISFNRLKTANIEKKDIVEFIDAVYNFVPTNEYFSIKSILNDGFDNKLFDLGFDNWFYASLITEDKKRFSYGKFGLTKVFILGNKEITFSKFIEDLVIESSSMELEDIINLLMDKYGCYIKRDKLIELIKSTSLYYNKIIEKVYIDYEIYLEEI